MIKRFYLSVLLIICLFSCNNSKPINAINNWMNSNSEIKIIVTTSMLYDLVSMIGKEKVSCLTLMPKNVSPHSYELVKGDMDKFFNADLIFCNGLNLEFGAGISYYLSNSDKVVKVGEYIIKNFPDRLIYLDEQIDPHIWMDISLWENAIDPILEKLVGLLPEDKMYLENNAEELRNVLRNVHLEIKNRFKNIQKDKKYLVTSHDSFQYFVKAYMSEDDSWKDHIISSEGFNHESHVNSADIKKIIDFLMDHDVKTMFLEKSSNRDIVEKIKKIMKEKNKNINFTNNVLYGDMLDENMDTYVDMMMHNANVIISGIK